MTKPGSHFYEFGPFRLDTADGVLLREGKPVALTPEAYVEDGNLRNPRVDAAQGARRGRERTEVHRDRPAAGLSLRGESGGKHIELGMADALMTKLSNIHRIDVRPTRAIARYTDRSRDLVSIGRELQVEGVLDGTVQRDGNRVRVTVQLVRVAREAPLGGAFRRELDRHLFPAGSRLRAGGAVLTLRLSVDEAEQLRPEHGLYRGISADCCRRRFLRMPRCMLRVSSGLRRSAFSSS